MKTYKLTEKYVTNAKANPKLGLSDAQCIELQGLYDKQESDGYDKEHVDFEKTNKRIAEFKTSIMCNPQKKGIEKQEALLIKRMSRNECSAKWVNAMVTARELAGRKMRDASTSIVVDKDYILGEI